MKKRIRFIALLALTAMVGGMLAGCGAPGEPVTVKYETADEQMGTVEGTAVQNVPTGAKAEKVTAKAAPGFRFVQWSDGSTEATREDRVKKAQTYTATFEVAPLNLPVLEFDTGGAVIADKENYVPLKVTVSNVEDAWRLTDEPAEIRLRGNYSLKVDKKSYRLRFETAQNLCGTDDGPARNWILVANFCDKTMLRTYLAFYLARQMKSQKFTSNAQWVEVYLNGDYQGVYLLCERVQVQQYRVNIENAANTDSTDTGYLVEMDRYAGEPKSFDFKVANIPYVIKSDVKNAAQKQYIADYMNQAFAAVEKGDRAAIESMIDMDSCVDMYILQEYLKNPDVGYSSFYFYKDKGSKLFFGPVWDFDLAAGNDKRMVDEGGTEKLFAGRLTGLTWLENTWYTRLMNMGWFKDKVAARWNELQSAIKSLPDEATRMTETYKDAIKRNFLRWPIYGIAQNMEPAEVAALIGPDAHLNYLNNWLKQRMVWMSMYFGGLV